MTYVLPPIEGTRFGHNEIDFVKYAGLLAAGEKAFYADPVGVAYLAHERYTTPFVKKGIAACAAKTIPADVLADADRYSRELVFTFQDFRSRVMRGQSHGALDSSKLARLAAPGISSREFDRLASTAFKHRHHSPSPQARPRIAIVADMNNDIRSKNPGYVAAVGRLAFVIGEAARITGVELAMFGSRGCYGSQANNWRRNRGMRPAHPLHVPMRLKAWDAQITPAQYALMTSHHGFASAIRAATALVNQNDNGMESSSGAGGIEFARMQGAQIVVGIGRFTNDETPDITISPSASLDDAVRAIVDHMNRRQAA